MSCSYELSVCQQIPAQSERNSNPKLLFMKSFTKRRFQLLAKSQEAVGFRNVWTLKGNIYCYFEGKRHCTDDFGDIKRMRFSHLMPQPAFCYVICMPLTTPHNSTPENHFLKLQVFFSFFKCFSVVP